MREISINKGKSRTDGGCNSCSQYVGANYIVYEITLRSLSFRLCVDCKDELLRLLKERK